MDRLLGEAWLTGNEDVFQQIFHLIFNENVSGRYMPLLPLCYYFCENIANLDLKTMIDSRCLGEFTEVSSRQPVSHS